MMPLDSSIKLPKNTEIDRQTLKSVTNQDSMKWDLRMSMPQ